MKALKRAIVCYRVFCFLLHKHSPARCMPVRGGCRALPVAIWSALPEVIRTAAAGAVTALSQHLLMRARGGQDSREKGQT